MHWLAGILACSMSMVHIDPNEQIGNPQYCSANGRFCAVVRVHEGIADFKTERMGKVFGLDEEKLPEPEPEPNEWVELAMEDEPEPEPEPEFFKAPDPVPTTVIAALYDNRRLVTTVHLPRDRPGNVLVSDSGRFLVMAGQPMSACGQFDSTLYPPVTIYRTDGTPVGEVKLDEIVSQWDRQQMQYARLEFELRRDVLVIGMPGPDGPVERRIDLATAKLLDPLTQLYPLPRVTVAPLSDAENRRGIGAPPPDCAAAFDDPALVRIDSAAFFRRAISTPVPEYPMVALKARITGPVRVEAVVSPWGEVACVRSSPLPFGLDKAAQKAIREWRFRPLFAGGRRVPFAGEVVFRFQR